MTKRRQTLAETVVTRRGELGLTQAQLARKAGVAGRTIQNIEYGRRPLAAVLAAVARALEMETADLLRIANDEQPARYAS